MLQKTNKNSVPTK